MALALGDHTISGILTGMEPKGDKGWWSFSIKQPDQQYPIKAETKKQEIIDQARALMGTPVQAQINVADSGNENPNRPGTNYQNRYLNAIGQDGSFGQDTAPAQEAQPQQQRASGGGGRHTGVEFDPVRMARMGGSERAVQMAAAGLIPPEQQTVQGMVEVAETWAAYYLLGPARFGVKAYDAAPEQEQGQLPPDYATQQQATGSAQTGEQQAALPVSSADVNTDDKPCVGCGAVPGELHADDCIPF